MKYSYIPTTQIRISKLAVGGMSFGNPAMKTYRWILDENHTDEMVQHALNLGINFFDTANVYGAGTSETFIGNSLKKHHIPREKVVLASKVYFNLGRLSKDAINREIDGTLKRLQTDYLDLYIIHRFDYEHPIEETMEALNNLVKEGKVRALGASAMYGYQFQNMQHVAEKNNWKQFVAMENHYNLLYREDERELIPICKQDGVMLMPYSPLAGGHLTRASWQGQSQRSKVDTSAMAKYDHAEQQDFPIVQRVAELADRHHVKMAQIALAWEWAKGVTAPIVGATKAQYLDDAVAAMDIQLTSDEVKYLDELYTAHEIVGALDRNPTGMLPKDVK
ncbi:aldo/keto reductase [Limosilactobacillus sp. STM2_1]|uniref:Aldo/keto reductase n=1 Tax=Limosilactobacillus rudii TaxID=2759755 RepID=A0A7W3UJA9_9LACO|nr:aldo/keto reductase [Limosilactobacillus rudii]MBB1078496.1 aldo/keto reductase [Limosilactobacillus rudii]MBB1096626.1 aldo/keto reductase [Limosilactobacillus rudii]MCD7134179.1 aldo/keto reductase [Limosilactobacillus rudii]